MVTFPDILLLSSPKLIHLYMVLFAAPAWNHISWSEDFAVLATVYDFLFAWAICRTKDWIASLFTRHSSPEHSRLYILGAFFFLFVSLLQFDGNRLERFYELCEQSCAFQRSKLAWRRIFILHFSHKSKQHWWVLNGRNSCMLQSRWFLLFAFVICKLFFQYVT